MLSQNLVRPFRHALSLFSTCQVCAVGEPLSSASNKNTEGTAMALDNFAALLASLENRSANIVVRKRERCSPSLQTHRVNRWQWDRQETLMDGLREILDEDKRNGVEYPVIGKPVPAVPAKGEGHTLS
jgi:hypothetical protein